MVGDSVAVGTGAEYSAGWPDQSSHDAPELPPLSVGWKPDPSRPDATSHGPHPPGTVVAVVLAVVLEEVLLVLFAFQSLQRLPELTGRMLVLLVLEVDEVIEVVLVQLLDTLVVDVLWMVLPVLGFQFSQPCGSATATLTEAASWKMESFMVESTRIR